MLANMSTSAEQCHCPHTSAPAPETASGTTSNTCNTQAQSQPQHVGLRNVLTLAVCILGFTPMAFTRPTPDVQPQPDIVRRTLPNFHVVHDYFYRGAAPSYPGMDRLKTMGVKTVIDLRKTPIMLEAERNYVGKLGIEYVSIPMGDWVPSKEKMQLFLSVMNEAAQDKSKGPVFLHCSHGSDRTGFLTAVWRVQHDHWSLGQAIVEMLRYGFVVHKLDPDPAARIDN